MHRRDGDMDGVVRGFRGNDLPVKQKLGNPSDIICEVEQRNSVQEIQARRGHFRISFATFIEHCLGTHQVEFVAVLIPPFFR